jgi:hypothetical protein
MKQYDIAFPGVSVQVMLSSYSSAPNVFTRDEARDAAVVTSHVPVIQHVFSRSAFPKVCAPDLYLSTVQTSDRRRPPPDTWRERAEKKRRLREVTRKVKGGRKLSRADKGLLEDPTVPARTRAALVVAYVVNRCGERRRSLRRITLPLFFTPEEGSGGDAAHANQLYIVLKRDIINLQIYEPNGESAYKAYGTERSIFRGLDAAVRPLLINKRRRVHVVGVGAGLQTLLGAVTSHKRGRTTTTTWRGYPICAAVSTYELQNFLRHREPAESLRHFDAQLVATLQKSTKRHALQRKVLRWITEVADWTRYHYERELRSQYERIFADSNVREIDVSYGAVHFRVRL